jgi:hypothetical protein
VPLDVPMTPGSSRALALRCSVVMKAAMLDFVREAEVLHQEVTGQGPPVDKVSALQFAMQQECAAVQENPDILAVRDTRFVWDRVSDRILQPALALALGSAAVISETARPWHELFAQIQQLTADVSPPTAAVGAVPAVSEQAAQLLGPGADPAHAAAAAGQSATVSAGPGTAGCDQQQQCEQGQVRGLQQACGVWPSARSWRDGWRSRTPGVSRAEGAGCRVGGQGSGGPGLSVLERS